MKNTMKQAFAVATFLFAISALSPQAMACGATVTGCLALIGDTSTAGALMYDTNIITGVSDKDRIALLGKLGNAKTKLNQAKLFDAIQKVNDYVAKVNELAAAGKINTDSARGVTVQDLLNDANAVIACIQNIC